MILLIQFFRNFMKPKPIGIIGGAGPIAGISLLEQIFCFARDVYGCWKDEDFPKVLVISFPFSDMLSETLEISSIQNELKSCLKKLRADGAAVLGIACNTLHAFLDREEMAQTDLLQLPQIAMEEVISAKTRPLILGTSTSIRFDLFSKRFPCVYPDPEMQIKVDELIVQTLKGKNVLKQLQALIAEQEAETVLLGCTELSLYTNNLLNSNKKIVDPLRVMAQKLIKISIGV